MVEENENYFSPNQFANPDNIKCHEWTTGFEIKKQLISKGRGEIAAIVSGAGTGGTIMGTKRALERFVDPMPKFVMVTPAESHAHGIQGIGDGGDYLANREEIDEVISITTEEAIERAKKLAREDGLLVGISSGANVLASERWMKDNEFEGVVVTFLCDRGERYLSIFD